MTDTPAQTLFDEWDERYHSFLDRLPAQRPNPAVVTEITGRPAGTALDIGCGMGADAVWLATQGWDVTAIDVSRVALDRAAAHAAQAGVAVTWRRSRLEDLELPDGGFDLVTAHYPALLHSPGRDAEQALLTAVAPGGLLLVVHHADIDVELAKSHGFDPAVYSPARRCGRPVRRGLGCHRRPPPAAPGTGRPGRSAALHDDVVLARRAH